MSPSLLSSAFEPQQSQTLDADELNEKGIPLIDHQPSRNQPSSRHQLAQQAAFSQPSHVANAGRPMTLSSGEEPPELMKILERQNDELYDENERLKRENAALKQGIDLLGQNSLPELQEQLQKLQDVCNDLRQIRDELWWQRDREKGLNVVGYAR